MELSEGSMSQRRPESQVIEQRYPARGKAGISLHNTHRPLAGVIRHWSNIVQCQRPLAITNLDLVTRKCGVTGLGVRQTLR
jgi:hypothetical protein